MPKLKVGNGMTLIDKMHRRLVVWALKRAEGSPAEAARILGVSSAAVYMWADRFDIPRRRYEKHTRTANGRTDGRKFATE